jgi:hypothetical protein
VPRGENEETSDEENEQERNNIIPEVPELAENRNPEEDPEVPAEKVEEIPKFTQEEKQQAMTLKLDKLKSIVLDSPGIAQDLIKHFEQITNLEHLKLTYYYQNPNHSFTEFFLKQEKLKSLDLAGWSDCVFRSLFQVDRSEEIKFKLEKLNIECEMSDHRHFTSFLRSQSQMKEFVLGGHNICFNYYRILFNEMQNLTKLTLPIDWFLTDERMNEIVNCRVESMRDLYVVGSNDDSIVFKTVIDIFPNLEKLRVENLVNFSASSLGNLRQLRHLHVENYRGECLMFVRFEQLKTLEIDYLFPFGLDFVWDNFTANNPGLEKLIIREIGNFKITESIKKEVAIIVNSLQNLESLQYFDLVRNASQPIVNPDIGARDPRPQADWPYFKILADGRAKTLQICQFIQRNCENVDLKLKQIFADYEVVNLSD